MTKVTKGKRAAKQPSARTLRRRAKQAKDAALMKALARQVAADNARREAKAQSEEALMAARRRPEALLVSAPVRNALNGIPDTVLERAARQVQRIRVSEFIDRYGAQHGIALLPFTPAQKVALLQLVLDTSATERAMVLDIVQAQLGAEGVVVPDGFGERLLASVRHWRGLAEYEPSRATVTDRNHRLIERARDTMKALSETDVAQVAGT